MQDYLFLSNLTDTREAILSLKEFQLDDLFETPVLGRAYLLIDKVRLVAENDQSLTYQIQGSGTYTIAIQIEQEAVKGSCNCPFTGNCKHMAAVLLFELAQAGVIKF